ncbi:MAG: hypothetical protein JSR66_01030 [Proteobacteria bacterium]|nr:hypothetical protein [Pseudomonadota bacterium]
MSVRIPPRMAAWLLKYLGPRYRRDSLVGDLFEEYQQGRSRAWYWRQTGMAVLMGLRVRLPKFVLTVVLRVLIEMGIIVGGIALAQSNVPQHHSEHMR